MTPQGLLPGVVGRIVGTRRIRSGRAVRTIPATLATRFRRCTAKSMSHRAACAIEHVVHVQFTTSGGPIEGPKACRT
jgi:hypothetical protein